MRDRAAPFNLASILMSLVATLCLSYSTIHRFHGHEFGNVTADGGVSAMPDYVQWEATNDKFAAAGLVIIVVATAAQAIAAFISARK
jgi:hypothetical protein